MRTFNVVDVTEILVHWRSRSLIEIAESLGVESKTVKKCVPLAGNGGAGAGQGLQVGSLVERLGAGVVPVAGQYATASDRLARDRDPPRLHRGDAAGLVRHDLASEVTNASPQTFIRVTNIIK